MRADRATFEEAAKVLGERGDAGVAALRFFAQRTGENVIEIAAEFATHVGILRSGTCGRQLAFADDAQHFRLASDAERKSDAAAAPVSSS